MTQSKIRAADDAAPGGEQLAAGRYAVEERLAAGGMGVVWRVLERATGQTLALKRLNTEGPNAARALHAFQREYEVLKGISHPRIIRVFDYGVDDVGPYYTMELLGGLDLRAVAPVDWRTACGYLRDLATSLALLHARNFVHRDISPSNVRVTPEGHCKLFDFGALAPFGVSKLVVGTAPLVPPEAVRGEPLDQRSDLYALGALAYWTLTGRQAYPAKTLNELPKRWQTVPPSLVTLNSEVPPELDALVTSLLSFDPRARPSSAAEVIALLTSIAELRPERTEDAGELLQSFLTNPRFVGRRAELARIDGAVAQLSSQSKGCALRFEAASGMGRSRLLEEAGLRAQLSGAAVVRIDASVQAHGSAVENIVLRLLDTTPTLGLSEAMRFRGALSALSAEVAARLSPKAAVSGEYKPEQQEPSTHPIEDWIVALCQRAPIVLLIDNVERADAASLALLSGLAIRAPALPLVLLLVERPSSEAGPLGLRTLRSKCETRRIEGLSADEILELARSLFGAEAANVERFAGWLHRQTAGGPLYFLELVRHLVERDAIRYVGGLWVLPQQRPDAALPERLDSALAERVHKLRPEARRLCSRLALHRLDIDFALCEQLVPAPYRAKLPLLLEELTSSGFLCPADNGYAFASVALRDVVVQAAHEYEQVEDHRQLGAALARMAGSDNHRLRMEAGWHLIQGGREAEGADLIRSVTCHSVVMRHMVANLYQVGRTVAAALDVYARQRRSPYERMPLLGALAQAGFYENPVWGERYGDQALDVLQDISGIATARRMRPFLGRFLSLVFGLCSGFMRFMLTPKRERPYSFPELVTQLLSAATTLTGMAACSLDADRADSVAQVIEPFSVLPERLTPVGIYQFCLGLQQIARERQTEASATFEKLLIRFRDPRYYPTLPPDGRILYVTGLLFAMGSFAIFRAQSKAALEAAAELEASGLKMYAMVASQLRYLYHANRGELEEAAKHRERVELHAAHVGSAGQVERWESPALIPLSVLIGDVVSATRAVHRLRMDASASYLRPYRRLAEAALELIVDSTSVTSSVSFLAHELSTREPRHFIGWGLTASAIARVHLVRGEPKTAEAWCLRALEHVDDRDREYVNLFLDLDVQLSNAQAAQGRHTEAIQRLERLIARFEPSGHPLALGLLHEARARIAHAAGRREDYYLSTREAERWLRPTNTPQLIAKCERLWELSRQSAGNSMRPDATDPASCELTSAGTVRTETMMAESSSDPS